MYQTSLFPLRTIVGNASPILKGSSIRKVFESTESKKLKIKYGINLKPSIIDTTTSPHYANYLPIFDIGGTTISPGEGMDILPVPPNPRPFGDNDPVISFFALSKKEKTATDVSRKLSARFLISLPDNFLVGGICFGGFPYLSSQHPTLSQGENSANFGLPREVRLTCTGAATRDQKDTAMSFEYLDSEISATKQEIVSHSGFHFLCIDPTLTMFITVHFSDYPRIPTRVTFDNETNKFTEVERYGFIIPYFYVFEYKEKTRYRPALPAGLLGTTTNNEIVPNREQPFSAVIDYRGVIGSNYFDFTAASMFGQQRTYTIRDAVYDGEKPKGKVKEQFEECFISLKVEPQKNVILYFAQGEEYERCVAGLKIFLPFIPEVALKEDLDQVTAAIREFFPSAPDRAALIETIPREDLENFLRQFLKIPDDIDFCEKIGLKVYEIDPLEGVSPLTVPLNDKYATLLAEKEIDELSEISLALFLEGVKFVRPSNSTLFALELTNLDDKPGRFVVKGLKLVQSAHVSVHPRAARTQQVKTLNFRIIGADLAEDYSFLGNEGFNFSIERLVAGERKDVLFRANSLLDLLHTGVAKIFSNARRRAVEFEKTEHGQAVNDRMGEAGEDYEERYAESRMSGWRRSETGDGVEEGVQGTPEWDDWYDGGGYWTPHGINKFPNAFESYANQETRTHTQILYPQTEPWLLLKTWFNVLQANAMATLGMEPKLPVLNVSPFGDANFPSRYWRGIINPLPPIDGLRQIVASPASIPLAELLALGGLDVTKIFSLLFQNDSNSRLLKVILYGGANSNIGRSAGFASGGSSGGFSRSLGAVPFPLLTHNTMVGSQGSITNQATRTGYTYSQYLNNSLDEGNTYSRFSKGEMKRLVTRREVPDTDRERIKGAEVMWQGELADIITGSIPLNFTLPATASKMHFRTSDDSLRVRFGSGVGASISVDFWFDLTEEIIRDDN